MGGGGAATGVHTLLIVICGYCVFSTAEVVLIKSLDRWHVVMPVWTCLCENGYWMLQGAMYRYVSKRTPDARPVSFRAARGYMVIGTVAGATSLLRCVGINGLPGSVYVVVSCSDVVFNTLLNKVFLKKTFTRLHCEQRSPSHWPVRPLSCGSPLCLCGHCLVSRYCQR
jgi:hypothetical protein